MTAVTKTDDYTEVHRTVLADIIGAEPLDMGTVSAFTPTRITVKYDFRSHLPERGWEYRIELTGPWIDTTRPGRACVLTWGEVTPTWARDFALANRPTTRPHTYSD